MTKANPPAKKAPTKTPKNNDNKRLNFNETNVDLWQKVFNVNFFAPIIFWFLYKINFNNNLFYGLNISILEFYLVTIISILIYLKHIPNIKRLILGNESKI